MLVGLFAAQVGFVDLDRAYKPFKVAGAPCLADALEHEPSCFLRHTDIPVQLHGRNALEAGQVQVDRDGPLFETDLRAFQYRTDAN